MVTLTTICCEFGMLETTEVGNVEREIPKASLLLISNPVNCRSTPARVLQLYDTLPFLFSRKFNVVSVGKKTTSIVFPTGVAEQT